MLKRLYPSEQEEDGTKDEILVEKIEDQSQSTGKDPPPPPPPPPPSSSHKILGPARPTVELLDSARDLIHGPTLNAMREDDAGKQPLPTHSSSDSGQGW